LAQNFAAQYTAKVQTLFAANTLHSVVGMDQRMPYALDLQTTPIEDIRAGFAAGLNGWKAEHPDQSDLVELLLAEAGGRILEAEMRMRLSALKFGPELEGKFDNVITIESDDDPLIPTSTRDAVRARNNPKSAYQFTWGGHFPYVVRPQEYTALLKDALGIGEATFTQPQGETFRI
jgi:pimeloyl-ACP methyl ester carboxylesterase